MEEKSNYSIVKYKFSNPKYHIDFLNRMNHSFLLKKTSESTTIICDDTKIIYSHSSKFPRNKIYLFNIVNREVSKWLKEKGDIILPPTHKASRYNYDYNDELGKITGTDLNHAYWRIAFKNGLISEKTYTAGLDEECKVIRLATISILGRKKHYDIIENGEVIETVLLDSGDENKRKVFKLVRFFCFQMMYQLSLILGDDFDSWNTDCIYYRDTPENRELVYNFFDSKDMTYKQLEY